MKKRNLIVSAALMSALVPTVMVRAETAPPAPVTSACTWKELNKSELDQLKPSYKFVDTKLNISISVPASEGKRFSINTPSDNRDDVKKLELNSLDDHKDHPVEIGAKVSFCATSTEADLATFLDLHKADGKVKLPLEISALTSSKEFARLGVADGDTIVLIEPAIFSSAFSKAEKLESDFCASCIVDAGEVSKSMDDLSELGTKSAKDLILELAKADVSKFAEDVAKSDDSFSSLTSKIQAKQKWIKDLKISKADKEELYSQITGMLEDLKEQAMAEAIKGGEKNVSSYAKDLQTIHKAMADVPGISKEDRRELLLAAKDYSAKGENTEALLTAAKNFEADAALKQKEKSLNQKVSLLCKGSVMTQSCYAAQQGLAKFKFDQQVAQQRLADQNVINSGNQTQNPFVQQMLQQNGASVAAVPLKNPQGPEFFASYNPSVKTQQGDALFTEGAPAVAIPLNMNSLYNVNQVYQNQSAPSTAQTGNQDYMSVLLNAQKHS